MAENILFICAHSDDHVLGCGGTIAKYVKEGKNVHVIILSYGEKTHLWMKPSYTRKMREAETREADKILGCYSKFFDLREGHFLEDYMAIRNELVSIAKKEKPAKVFTHSNEDPHPDHRASFEITMDIIKESRVKPELYLFSIWNPFSLRKSHLPKLIIDISKVHGEKISAIKKFKSQWAALGLLMGVLLTKEVKNGLHVGGMFAESFYRFQ